MSHYSLLPENASRLERAFEQAFADMLGDIEAPFPELLDPQRTPPAMLPYLAQDRGVMEWDGEASTELLRRTVANVWPIRRLAGTRRALVLAVDELDYDAEVIAWYDSGAYFARPYNVEVIAEARDGAVINRRVVEQMLRNLDYAKSERDVLQLTLLLRQSLGFRIAGAVGPTLVERDDAPDGRTFPAPPIASTLKIAGAIAPAITQSDETGQGAIRAAPAVTGRLGFTGALHRTQIQSDERAQGEILPSQAIRLPLSFVAAANAVIVVDTAAPGQRPDPFFDTPPAPPPSLLGAAHHTTWTDECPPSRIGESPVGALTLRFAGAVDWTLFTDDNPRSTL